jgi:hypothetical protein
MVPGAWCVVRGARHCAFILAVCRDGGKARMKREIAERVTLELVGMPHQIRKNL